MDSISQNTDPQVNTSQLAGRYWLEAEISRGPTGSFYRAIKLDKNQKVAQTVAIKLFHERYYTDPRFAFRFRELYRSLARHSHSNLVAVVDYGVERGRYYIVMEWINGVELSTVIAEHGPFSPLLAQFIARQVCSAIEVVHQLGLIHQGIQPENILLTPGGQVKVTNVGLNGLLSESGLSKTHVMLTGVGYLSPEQARGKKMTPESDVYSLGVTLFEMLTGRLPFEANDAWSIVRMHAQEAPPSPRDFNSQVPEELANIVASALQKEPESRYPSAAEMGAALASLQTESVPGTTRFYHSGGYSNEAGVLSTLGALLKPNGLRRLLSNRWQIAGRMLPFGGVLTLLFILVFMIAFVIIYALIGKL